MPFNLSSCQCRSKHTKKGSGLKGKKEHVSAKWDRTPSANNNNKNNNNNNNNNNIKTKVIPVIIGATGTISKSFRKYMSNIPQNHEVKELQKTAILGTAHILRKVLTQRVNAGTSDIRTMNSYIRIVATQCSLGTWFVSRI